GRKEIDGGRQGFDRWRVDEEPDRASRRGGFAIASRRTVRRDRRPLQPADRAFDDRARRGEGPRLARQGRAAERRRRAAGEGEEHWRLTSSTTSRDSSSTSQTR